MSSKLYRRRPRTVEVREVTADNIEEISAWAHGNIYGGTLFIPASVGRAHVNPVYPGNLIVHEGVNFSVWRDREFFDATFESLT